jgi:limonene-1,2-epoxide hydrolase
MPSRSFPAEVLNVEVAVVEIPNRRRFVKAAGVTLAATAATTLSSRPASAEGVGEPGPGTKLVESFCATWSHLNASKLAAYFTANAVYQNMPIPGVISGRDAIKQNLADQISVLQYTTLNIKQIVAYRNTVIATRVDSYRFVNADHDVDLPIVGVFELAPDFRHFTSWTDYFDLAHSEYSTVSPPSGS